MFRGLQSHFWGTYTPLQVVFDSFIQLFPCDFTVWKEPLGAFILLPDPFACGSTADVDYSSLHWINQFKKAVCDPLWTIEIGVNDGTWIAAGLNANTSIVDEAIKSNIFVF